MNLNKLFIDYCKDENLEINENQINVVESINKFYHSNFRSFSLINIFYKKKKNQVFTYKEMWV